MTTAPQHFSGRRHAPKCLTGTHHTTSSPGERPSIRKGGPLTAPTARLVRLRAALGEVTAVDAVPAGICVRCAELLDVDGATISLVSAGRLHGSLCSSDDLAGRLEGIEFGLGEGPCGAAFASAAPVLEPSLATAVSRWPIFATEAIALGVGAVFSFPLGPGMATVGALTLHRMAPRDLTDHQLQDALVVADLITDVIVSTKLGLGVDEGSARLREVGASRAEIHQATGMVAVQLEVSPADALSHLRAHAWSVQRPLADVAADVVGRRLRFPTEPGDEGDQDG